MNQTYHIFGLNIQSAIPLPAPPVADPTAGGAADVIIEFAAVPDQTAEPHKMWGHFQASPDEFFLCVDSVARYGVRNGCRIAVDPAPGAREEEILIFLMGSAFGALLHQRNILVLHAGAVAVKHHGVIFAGPSGIGKSTLAAGFHKRGYPFLADDVCAVAGAGDMPCVVPGFPRLKLWGDVLKKLDTGKEDLKSIRWTGGLEKYFLPVESIHKTPIPLKSVFVLEKSHEDAIGVTALSGSDKIDALIRNTYRLGFLNGQGGRKEHFRQCAQVAARSAVYGVLRPQNGFRLEALMDRLEDIFNRDEAV
jgi:hypothetical protein